MLTKFAKYSRLVKKLPGSPKDESGNSAWGHSERGAQNVEDVYGSENFANTAETYSIFNIPQKILLRFVLRSVGALSVSVVAGRPGRLHRVLSSDIAADYTNAVHLHARDCR